MQGMGSRREHQLGWTQAPGGCDQSPAATFFKRHKTRDVGDFGKSRRLGSSLEQLWLLPPANRQPGYMGSEELRRTPKEEQEEDS